MLRHIIIVLSICSVSYSQSSFQLSDLSGIPQLIKMAPQLVKAFQESAIDGHCQTVMRDFLQSVTEQDMNALRMLDASGKPGQGLLKGHIHWMGNYDECIDIALNQSTKSNLHIETEGLWHRPIGDTQYCVVAAAVPRLMEQINPVRLGPFNPTLNLDLCLPKGCSGVELLQLINNSVTLPGVDVLSVSCVQYNTGLWEDPAVIVSITILSVFAILTVIGTCVDVGFLFRSQIAVDPEVEMIQLQQNGRLNNGDALRASADFTYTRNGIYTVSSERNSNAKSGQNGTSTKTSDEKKPTEIASKPLSLPVRLLKAFSIRENLVRLLNCNQGKGTLGCLNGIRVLSMAWVILGHVFTMIAVIPNLAETRGIGQSFFGQAILNGTLSVDTFFLLSGLLVAYLFCRDYDKGGRKLTIKKMAFFYFHRIWRLTPFYMLLLMLYTSFFRHMRNGPLWPEEFMDADGCRQYWWHNLLYVNNLLNGGNKPPQCMGVAWYLANDMQFYILSPIVLIPLLKKPAMGWATIVILIFVHVVSTAALIVHIDGSMFSANDYNTVVYIKPYCRVGVYAIGLGLGYTLFKRKTFRMKRMTNVICWFLSLTLMLVLTYVTYIKNRDGGTVWGISAQASFEALFRVAWALCVSWVIFACCKGYGGFINSILSWSAWVPLTRVTFAAYLIHPVVLVTYELSRRQLFYYNMYNVIYLFVSGFFISYGIAFLLSVTMEAPLLSIERVIRNTK